MSISRKAAIRAYLKLRGTIDNTGSFYGLYTPATSLDFKPPRCAHKLAPRQDKETFGMAYTMGNETFGVNRFVEQESWSHGFNDLTFVDDDE